MGLDALATVENESGSAKHENENRRALELIFDGTEGAGSPNESGIKMRPRALGIQHPIIQHPSKITSEFKFNTRLFSTLKRFYLIQFLEGVKV
jgi:hypothetical protein